MASLDSNEHMGDYWRDVKSHRRRAKEQKKQRSANPPPRERCYDWIIVSGPYHYAINRSSFKQDTYKRFKKPFLLRNGEMVLGQGSVELGVQSSPRSGSKASKIILEEVLHLPTAKCNGFSQERKLGLGSSTVFGVDGVRGYLDGEELWGTENYCGLWKLLLSGKRCGSTHLETVAEEDFEALSLRLDEGDINDISKASNDVPAKANNANIRPQTKIPKLSEERCWDWMVVSGFNYARDRSSFDTYYEINTTLRGTLGGKIKVCGVGTVVLQVPKSSTVDSKTHTLVLKFVLHIPNAMFNGFSPASLEHGYRYVDDTMLGHDKRGKPSWYANKSPWGSRLAIAGCPQGVSPFSQSPNPGGIVFLSVHATEEELEEIYKQLDIA
jgi:hypothetical protein